MLLPSSKNLKGLRVQACIFACALYLRTKSALTFLGGADSLLLGSYYLQVCTVELIRSTVMILYHLFGPCSAITFFILIWLSITILILDTSLHISWLQWSGLYDAVVSNERKGPDHNPRHLYNAHFCHKQYWTYRVIMLKELSIIPKDNSVLWCILTSKWVLHMPFPGQNRFLTLKQLFPSFSIINVKIILFFALSFLFSFLFFS